MQYLLNTVRLPDLLIGSRGKDLNDLIEKKTFPQKAQTHVKTLIMRHLVVLLIAAKRVNKKGNNLKFSPITTIIKKGPLSTDIALLDRL